MKFANDSELRSTAEQTCGGDHQNARRSPESAKNVLRSMITKASVERSRRITENDVQRKKALSARMAARAENSHQSIGQPTSSQRIDIESIRTADVQPKTAIKHSGPLMPQPKTSQTYSDSFMAKNKPKAVLHTVGSFALTLLALLLVACGGSTGTTPNACPHRTHEVTDASGNPETDASGALVMVDNTPAEDQQICDYLAWLRDHVPNGMPDCTAQTGVMGSACGEAGAGGSP